MKTLYDCDYAQSIVCSQVERELVPLLGNRPGYGAPAGTRAGSCRDRLPLRHAGSPGQRRDYRCQSSLPTGPPGRQNPGRIPTRYHRQKRRPDPDPGIQGGVAPAPGSSPPGVSLPVFISRTGGRSVDSLRRSQPDLAPGAGDPLKS